MVVTVDYSKATMELIMVKSQKLEVTIILPSEATIVQLKVVATTMVETTSFAKRTKSTIDFNSSAFATTVFINFIVEELTTYLFEAVRNFNWVVITRYKNYIRYLWLTIVLHWKLTSRIGLKGRSGVLKTTYLTFHY